MVKHKSMTPKELAEWREKNAYSQRDLAAVLGVTNVCISRWENQAREIPSFLHLALRCLELERGETRDKKGKTKKKKGKEMKHERKHPKKG